MLLREHFRRLTNTLLKPFELHFSNNDDPFKSLITTKSIQKIFLSTNTKSLLDNITINDTINNISTNSNVMLTMPSILQRSEWKNIIFKFSKSKSFLAWYQSRTDLLCIKLWLDTCSFCKTMTNLQFLNIFDNIIINNNKDNNTNNISINDSLYEKLLQKLVCVIDLLTHIRSHGQWLLQDNDADILLKAMQNHLDHLLDYRNIIQNTKK
jgi:hypothetical protein